MAGPDDVEETGETGEIVTELQQLMLFRRWSLFLPRLISESAKLNAAYTLMRQQRNPAFFDQLREKLHQILQDCEVLEASGQVCSVEGGLENVLQVVLQSLVFAAGFLHNRQFHKAFALGELCVQVSDHVADSAADMTFWRLLCRAFLGSAYLQLRRTADARHVLEEAQWLGESVEETARSMKAILGACSYALAQADLDESSIDQAGEHVDAAIAQMESNLWEVSQNKEDQEVISTILATLYHFRGHCDFLCDRFDLALSWYHRALKVLGEHRDLGIDTDAIVEHVKHDIQRAVCLKPKEAPHEASS
ncbi:unnamed protein product [Symbiodinium natans]|uniref:KIF-binding protein n=1 Tax=Symbiodinium natans TaxID=878477 RepID=A0A812UZ27_9DINO|nr:unnamed protein product [Symbiodinium natans]